MTKRIPQELHKNRLLPGEAPPVTGGGKPRSPKLKPKERPDHIGGARPGAGRPRGGQNLLTVKALMEAIEARSGGQPYADILVEDFLGARDRQDHPLVNKYHQLILQKVMTTLVRAEVTDTTGEIEAKKAAFSDALANLVAKHSDQQEE